jgi:hypothetical protein
MSVGVASHAAYSVSLNPRGLLNVLPVHPARSRIRSNWQTATLSPALPHECNHVPSDNTKPAVSSGFVRLRGRDSNPNFLIQSQASYH